MRRPANKRRAPVACQSSRVGELAPRTHKLCARDPDRSGRPAARAGTRRSTPSVAGRCSVEFWRTAQQPVNVGHGFGRFRDSNRSTEQEFLQRAGAAAHLGGTPQPSPRLGRDRDSGTDRRELDTPHTLRRGAYIDLTGRRFRDEAVRLEGARGGRPVPNPGTNRFVAAAGSCGSRDPACRAEGEGFEPSRRLHV
jgi:hypothetical protein